MDVNQETVRAWKDGADGFIKWVQDVKPRIISPKGGFQVFRFTNFQLEAVRGALKRDKSGNWCHGTIAFSFPRRHSKTTLNALLVLWRFTLCQTENIKVMANSERQTLSIGFNMLKSIIMNTPFLLSQVGRDNVRTFKIEYPDLQNRIEAVPCSIASLYGERITCGWVSEIHAAQSEEPMQVLASSLGDSMNSWLLMDSTVDPIGGPLHRMEQLQESGDDPTVYVKRVEYRDLAEALEKSPPWIRRDWLESRSKQLLPAVFATQHLNQRTAAANNLFALEDIRGCMEDIPKAIEPDYFHELIQGRKYVCGGGLDRAFFGSLHGDKTIWTTVAKVADPESKEPEYWILNQKNIVGSLARGIKKAIVNDVEQYRLLNISLENYNSQDIFTWCLEMGYPAEVIAPTTTTQANAMPELYRLVREGRLKFSKELKGLADEMETFIYEMRPGGNPRFGSDRWNDDRIYSLCWAVYSLRNQELASYELGSVHCDSLSQHSDFCYLRKGDLILTCGERCPAHIKTVQMFNQYRSLNVESDVNLQEFFRGFVKVSGVKSYKMF